MTLNRNIQALAESLVLSPRYCILFRHVQSKFSFLVVIVTSFGKKLSKWERSLRGGVCVGGGGQRAAPLISTGHSTQASTTGANNPWAHSRFSVRKWLLIRRRGTLLFHQYVLLHRLNAGFHCITHSLPRYPVSLSPSRYYIRRSALARVCKPSRQTARTPRRVYRQLS